MASGPCVVIFRARLRELDAEYTAAATRLRALAMERYGCTAFYSVAADGEEISLSYWPDVESLGRWRDDAEHRRAQQRGRERWYADYSVEIAPILRAKTWRREGG